MEAQRLQRLVSEVALRELGEDENTRERGLEEMRKWVRKHPNIVNCRTDDNFLIRFLRVKKYNVLKAQQMLLNFLDLKNVLPPSLFGNHDIASPSLDEFMSNGFYFVSPNRDDKGRRVILLVVGRLNYESKQYTYETPARTILLSNFLMQENDASQVLGYTYIFDAAQISLGHLGKSYAAALDIIRFLKSGEAAIPMRNKEVHILNLPLYMTWFINLIKRTLTKKLRKRVMIHDSLETLQKAVNPRVLPKEYGGSTSMDDMIDLWKQELVRKRDVVLALNDMKLLRNKDRRQREDNGGGLEISFRNLQLD